MKKILIILFIFWGEVMRAQDTLITSSIIATQRDYELFQSYINQFSENEEEPLESLLVETGKFFLNKPYMSATLEQNDSEKLIINLREFDCQTFLETIVSLARTLQQKGDWKSYCENLEQIRYRSGKVKGYLSRLHYFSEWIIDNQKKNIVKDITAQIGGKELKLSINFISTHPQFYKQLTQHPNWISKIKETETCLNKETFYYLPKEELSAHIKQIKNGDLIAITTSIKGLDISHIGLAIWNNDVLHIMHASSDEKKVTITASSLTEYLKSNQKQTGIIVLRCVDATND